ncbi:MAG: aldehyde dehydrogenase family protein [bacterium]
MSDSVKELVERARLAQQIIEYWPQEQVDLMVAAVGWELYKEENAIRCAELAIRETGMGVYEDKLLKHRKKTLGVLRDLHGVQTVGVIETDEARGLIKIAKPVGVVAAIMPVTNPTSTPAGNGLAILKTRNAVIFGAHPRARETTGLVVELMRKGLRKAGAPVDLVQGLPEPSREAVRELMSAADLVVATGADAIVKAAYSSGTPAYGVGAGNACVVVDETAVIPDVARKVFLSKTFDNATSCSSENSLIIQKSIWNELIKALQAEGGYLCTAEDKVRLQATLWPDSHKLNSLIVARPARTIAQMASLQVPDSTRFLMVVGEEPLVKDLFAGEKLSPVVTLWRYDAFAEAVDYVERLTRACGYGHSCGIHSLNQAHIMELATKCHVSRMMVNQPQCYANSGNYDNGMPFTMTLGCGTWGGNITSDNIVWKHFLNNTWVSKPIPAVIPDENEIFKSCWAMLGKS